MKKRVLVIDDDTIIRNLFEYVLQPFDVEVEIIDAFYGLDMLKAYAPDVILLDIHLPNVNGIEILEMLKDDPATANIPVVIVSADDSPETLQELRRLQQTERMVKPFFPKPMRNLLERILFSDHTMPMT